jgi:Caspase domain
MIAARSAPAGKPIFKRAIAVFIISMVVALLAPSAAMSQSAEPRIAFVVGNGSDVRFPLPTALNDAGLVAEALRSIGFDVVEGADLNQTDFARSFRQFLTKVEAGGANAAAVIYFSGYGFEFDGDNFLVMLDARLERDGDIPLDTVRLSDLLRAFASTPARAKVVIADAARRLPFAMQGVRLANGLGAVDAPRRTLVAYSAAPGMVASDGSGPYGAFALAIAEMVRSPGLDLADAFARIRARTLQETQGRQAPWDVSAVGAPLVLVPPEHSSTQSAVMSLAALAPRSNRERSPEEAYASALTQDSLSGYSEFLAAFPRHADAPRIRAMLRARREALLWLRAVKLNTAAAIWTYLQRYPDGMYVGDAERRLGRLSAPLKPQPDFLPVEFRDVPPPLPDEPSQVADLASFIRPAPVLKDPQPAYLATLPAPATRIGARVLPTPVLPAMARLIAGMRHPLSSRTGLPGVAGPVATNGSQSIHSSANNVQLLASASAVPAGPPTAGSAVPLPTPAPRRATSLDKSRRQLAGENCRMRRGKEICD